MKKNLNFISGIFLAFLLLMSSCDDDNNNPNPSGGDTCFVTKMQGGNDKTEFVYSNDLLTRVNYDSASTGASGYINLERNASKQIIKGQMFEANGNSDVYVTYEYDNNGSVAKANYFIKDSGSSTFENLFYVGYEYTNKVLKKTTINFDFGIGAFIPVSATEYTLDAKGNITKTMQYEVNVANPFGPMQLKGSTEYQYDDKKNPLQVLSYLLIDPQTYSLAVSALSGNNITAKVAKDENGATTSSQTYTYEYNEAGYPTKQTTTSGATTQITIDYSCK